MLLFDREWTKCLDSQFRPSVRAPPLADIIGIKPHQVFNIVSRLACEEADIFRDGAYSYSLRLDDNGIWCIFHREVCTQPVPAFG